MSNHQLIPAVALLLGLVLLAMSPPGPALAQADDTLTLDEAIRTALARHWRLEMADARAEAARSEVDLARSRSLPRLEVSAGYSRTTNPVGVFGTLLRQEQFGPQNFDVGFLNEPDALGNFGLALQATQPLWTGGRLGHAAEAARLAADALEAGGRRTRDEVAHGAARAWGDAVLARYQLGVTREVLATATAHVALVSDLREAGLALESDLLQARLRASEAEEAVVRAGSAVELTEAALNLAIGRPVDTPVALPDAPSALEPRAPGAAERLTAEALQRRPDLESAGLQLAAAEAGRDLAAADRLPELGLLAAAEANDPDFFGFQGTNWTVAAMARWSIFDGGERRARQAQAAARAREARAARDLLRNAIGVQVRAGLSAYRAAVQRLEQSAVAVEMATESLRTVEDRYREGMVPLVELLDAQTMLTRSRAREVAARRDLIASQADLDLATASFDSSLQPPAGASR